MVKAPKTQRGFTLIELLIVVAIIGLLAAIAIPNLLNALQRAKQKRTMEDMRSIATAWESYAIDTDRYSAAGLGIPYATLSAKLAPEYIKKLPQYDGWGNPFVYLVSNTGNIYVIWSFGKDGSPQSNIRFGPTSDFNCDIIYWNGVFLQYPESVQGGATAPPPPEVDDLLD